MGASRPWDVWRTEHGYFFRRPVWEPLWLLLLLLLLEAGAGWSVAAPGSFLGAAGLCFSSLGGGAAREARGPSRACRTRTAATATMSPQSRAGASRGDSCFRSQWRARARELLELRARRALLSWRGRIEGVGGQRGSFPGGQRSPWPAPPAQPGQHLPTWKPNCLSRVSSVGSPRDTAGKNSSTHCRRHHRLLRGDGTGRSGHGELRAPGPRPPRPPAGCPSLTYPCSPGWENQYL